jgi:ribonuclease P protein component
MQSFSKSERLGNYRLQQLLFRKGSAFFSHPFRVVFLLAHRNDPEVIPASRRLPLPGSARFPSPARMMVSVPARKLRRAVDRNRVKRLVKEAYRKNKSGFYSFLNGRHEICLIAFVYAAREVLPGQEVEKGIIRSLQRLTQSPPGGVSGGTVAAGETATGGPKPERDEKGG